MKYVESWLPSGFPDSSVPASRTTKRIDVLRFSAPFHRSRQQEESSIRNAAHGSFEAEAISKKLHLIKWLISDMREVFGHDVPIEVALESKFVDWASRNSSRIKLHMVFPSR